MVPWGLVALLIGIAYGFFAKGKQDKSELFKKGIVIGIVIGIVLAILGVLTGAPALGFGGFIGAVVSAFIITLLFILGVWLGDVLEPKRK